MPFDSTVDPRREKIDRLLLVIDALENAPPDLGYCQSAWHCGTNACALGHALLKYGRIGDLHLRPARMKLNGSTLFANDTRGAYEVTNAFVHIGKTFGITRDEANEVFGLTAEDVIGKGSRTRERAIELVRSLHARKVAELQGAFASA